MKKQLIFIYTCLIFSTVANGAETLGHTTTRLEDSTEELSAVPRSSNNAEVSTSTAEKSARLRNDTVIEVHAILDRDYRDNVQDLVKTRWFFRKTANITESIGNTFVHLSAGPSAVAAATRLIGSEEASNIILFTGTACLALHIILIGTAKCSASESREREQQLTNLATEVKYKIVPLPPTIRDDALSRASAAVSPSGFWA